MNKQLYKNNEYTYCKTEDEYNALRFLIEQDGWLIWDYHAGYNIHCSDYGIWDDEFMSVDDGTFIPQEEMYFRGAPEWATLLVLTFLGGYAWLDINRIRNKVKFCYTKGTCRGTSSIHPEWGTATVIAKREIKPVTKKQKRESLLAQLAALDEPTPLASMLKPTTTLPDLIEARTLAAWVTQEAPNWNGEDSVRVYKNSGAWDIEHGDYIAVGGIKMPGRLAELLCEKLNRKEWTL